MSLVSTFSMSEAAQTLRQISTLTLEPERLAASLGPAALGAQLLPETWAPLNALLNGIGDPETNVRLFQSKAPLVADRIESLFPNPDQPRELIEHWNLLCPLTQPSSLLSASLAAGSPLEPSEEWPILLGGLFTFTDGTKATIPLDYRLLYETVFPLTFEVPTLGPDGVNMLRMPVMDRWHKARDYLSGHQQAARNTEVFDLSVTENTLTYKRQRGSRLGMAIVQALFEDDQCLKAGHALRDGDVYRSYRSSTVFERPLPFDPKVRKKQKARPIFTRTQEGTALTQRPDLPYPVLERWIVADRASEHSVELGARQRQFFFFAGAVWTVDGMPPIPIERFPHSLLGLAAAELKKRLSPGKAGILAVNSDPKSPLYEFLGSFGDRSRSIDLEVVPESPDGFPCDWRLTLNGALVIHSLPVNRETKEALEAWLKIASID